MDCLFRHEIVGVVNSVVGFLLRRWAAIVGVLALSPASLPPPPTPSSPTRWHPACPRYYLSLLPMDVGLGKALLFGAMLCCLDPVLTVVASLCNRSPLRAPADKLDEARAIHASFAWGRSDHLAVVKVCLTGWGVGSGVWGDGCVYVCMCVCVCVWCRCAYVVCTLVLHATSSDSCVSCACAP
jgi:hypothetical protein